MLPNHTITKQVIFYQGVQDLPHNVLLYPTVRRCTDRQRLSRTVAPTESHTFERGATTSVIRLGSGRDGAKSATLAWQLLIKS